MRRWSLFPALVVALLSGACSSGSVEEISPETTATTVTAATTATTESEQATQFLDQFAADWNAGDEMAVFGAILPDGVYVTPDGLELVGQEVVDQWTRFLSSVSIERTGDAVDNGDRSYSFEVEMSGSKRVLTIEMDGDELVSMVEDYFDFSF